MDTGAGKDGSGDFVGFNDIAKLFMAAAWLYENEGIKIEQILKELKKGKFGEIKNEPYRLPTGREFATYMVANRELMDTKIKYWHNLIHKYNLEKEMNLLVELLEVASNSLKKFDQSWPEMTSHLKLK